jgi:hypothetical protein
MCGASDASTSAKPAAATSATPVSSSTYPAYGNRFKPAQGITPESMAQLQAMRDKVIGRASGTPYTSAPQVFPQSAAGSPAQPVPAAPAATPQTGGASQTPDLAALSKMPFFGSLVQALMRRQAGGAQSGGNTVA